VLAEVGHLVGLAGRGLDDGEPAEDEKGEGGSDDDGSNEESGDA
ncbi:molybdenum cofactor biosynthesis protein, partial [Halorubrum sp. SS5]